MQTISTTDEQTTSADKKAISASKKTISADDPGGKTAAVSPLLFVFIFFSSTSRRPRRFSAATPWLPRKVTIVETAKFFRVP